MLDANQSSWRCNGSINRRLTGSIQPLFGIFLFTLLLALPTPCFALVVPKGFSQDSFRTLAEWAAQPKATAEQVDSVNQWLIQVNEGQKDSKDAGEQKLDLAEAELAAKSFIVISRLLPLDEGKKLDKKEIFRLLETYCSRFQALSRESSRSSQTEASQDLKALIKMSSVLARDFHQLGESVFTREESVKAWILIARSLAGLDRLVLDAFHHSEAKALEPWNREILDAIIYSLNPVAVVEALDSKTCESLNGMLLKMALWKSTAANANQDSSTGQTVVEQKMGEGFDGFRSFRLSALAMMSDFVPSSPFKGQLRRDLYQKIVDAGFGQKEALNIPVNDAELKVLCRAKQVLGKDFVQSLKGLKMVRKRVLHQLLTGTLMTPVEIPGESEGSGATPAKKTASELSQDANKVLRALFGIDDVAHEGVFTRRFPAQAEEIAYESDIALMLFSTSEIVEGLKRLGREDKITPIVELAVNVRLTLEVQELKEGKARVGLEHKLILLDLAKLLRTMGKDQFTRQSTEACLEHMLTFIIQDISKLGLKEMIPFSFLLQQDPISVYYRKFFEQKLTQANLAQLEELEVTTLPSHIQSRFLAEKIIKSRPQSSDSKLTAGSVQAGAALPPPGPKRIEISQRVETKKLGEDEKSANQPKTGAKKAAARKRDPLLRRIKRAYNLATEFRQSERDITALRDANYPDRVPGDLQDPTPRIENLSGIIQEYEAILVSLKLNTGARAYRGVPAEEFVRRELVSLREKKVMLQLAYVFWQAAG